MGRLAGRENWSAGITLSVIVFQLSDFALVAVDLLL